MNEAKPIIVPNIITVPPTDQPEHDYKGFWMDFTIADLYGKKAVRDTYKRAFDEWKDNVDYYASFVLTLNHRLWMHYDAGRIELAKLYDELWKKADSYGYRHFKGDDLIKYHNFLD